jgi:hypothetical protein
MSKKEMQRFFLSLSHSVQDVVFSLYGGADEGAALAARAVAQGALQSGGFHGDSGGQHVELALVSLKSVDTGKARGRVGVGVDEKEERDCTNTVCVKTLRKRSNQRVVARRRKTEKTHTQV